MGHLCGSKNEQKVFTLNWNLKPVETSVNYLLFPNVVRLAFLFEDPIKGSSGLK